MYIYDLINDYVWGSNFFLRENSVLKSKIINSTLALWFLTYVLVLLLSPFNRWGNWSR